MLTASGPKVLEHNTHFGDPEVQSMIPLLDDKTDLADVLLACTNGTLDRVYINTKDAFACTVIIAAGGYPESYDYGDDIHSGNIDYGTCFVA
jgi:phosphoribosylamine--glycine ligase/phosphoribosylformylglycinamidine cyclo-ligase